VLTEAWLLHEPSYGGVRRGNRTVDTEKLYVLAACGQEMQVLQDEDFLHRSNA
jgi:hypothetical protein